MMQTPAMMSAQMHGPAVTRSSAQDRDPDYSQQMVMQQSTYFQCVPESTQASHIHHTPYQASCAQQSESESESELLYD
jgi:hypothetical protein